MRTRRIPSILGCLIILLLAANPVCASSLRRDGTSIVVDGKTFASTRDCKGENWRFDAEEHTLYLDGYDGQYIDLSTQETATVVLSGDNKISSNLDAPALMVDGSLILQGEGSLTLCVSSCRSALVAKNGSLTLDRCSLTAESASSVTTEVSGYLVMADMDITVSGSSLSILDDMEGPGGGLGSLSGNISISDGASVSVHSNAKALSCVSGSVTVSGSSTKLDLFGMDNAIYSKQDLLIEESSVSATSEGAEATVVFCPEGVISVRNAEVKVIGNKTAMAGKMIVLTDAYIDDPFDAKIREISDMATVILDEEVVSSVKISRGVAPTPTPTPTPTPVPTAVPQTVTPQAQDGTGFTITPRMILGGVLVIVGLVTVIILVSSKMRGK